MNKLTALIEVAKDAEYCKNDMRVHPATIIELCALLEKAEDVLTDTQKIMNMWPSSSLDIAVTEALAAIKQWKER